MADIATRWDTATGTGDWTIDRASQIIWTDETGASIVDQNGRVVSAAFDAGTGLVEGNDLQTAVLISLFSDAVAADDDVITDRSGDPRGWWAGPIGSKLWLRARSRVTPQLPALVKDDIEQALAWLIEDRVLSAIDVEVEFTTPTMLGARVVFRRSDGRRAELRFSRLWESI
ncbi:phage GP46 family protein [Sphingomonas sp. Leaf25]|uniref:phage GP46 family protein n=1 Tax=Sphingomonas sp. Leaf25 TaxID=1735692 RepID=UPI0006FEF2D4|nr:phage GP46 family protein [Sphingomonas sp. Leaf25]KQN00575.1 hypothetical protein ASE78_05680 [Sphingomonas sp. Leaf25]